jgi:hypothetical protein
MAGLDVAAYAAFGTDRQALTVQRDRAVYFAVHNQGFIARKFAFHHQQLSNEGGRVALHAVASQSFSRGRWRTRSRN